MRFIFKILLFLPLVFSLGCDEEAPIVFDDPILLLPDHFTSQTEVAYFYSDIGNFAEVRDAVVESGYVWDTKPFTGFDAANRAQDIGYNQGKIEVFATLKPSTQYYVRSYVSYQDQDFFSNESKIFTRVGKWSKVSTFPGTPKNKATSFVIDDIAYIAGGNSDELWAFNPEDDSWLQKASLPRILEGAVSFVINGKGYVGSGVVGSLDQNDDNFWVYHPDTDQWNSIAVLNSFQGGVQNWAQVAFVRDGFGYIQSNDSYLSKYDPSQDVWSFYDPEEWFKSVGNDYTFASNNDTVIVVHDERVQMFSGNPDKWEIKNEFPEGPRMNNGQGQRRDGIGFYLKGKFYIGMGQNGNDDSRYDLFQYDPFWDGWGWHTNLIPGPEYGFLGFQHAVSFVINDIAYIGLGVNKHRYANEHVVTPNLDFYSFEPE